MHLNNDHSNQAPAHTRRVYAWVFILLLLFISGLAVFVDQLNREQIIERQRQQLLQDLSVLRARFEGALAADIQMVRGLTALVVNEPNLDQRRFAQFARPFLGSHSQIRNIGAAPDMILSLMYPLEGNESAIGLNYLSNSKQRAQAVAARDSGELVLAGPLKLVQGGQGIIGRIPVFIPGKQEQSEFWGLISVVLDMDKVYKNVGLDDYSKRFRLAIRHKGGANANAFYGDSSVFLENAVRTEIRIPGAVWELAALPRLGWLLAGSELWLPRILFTLLFSVAVLFAISVSRWARRQQLTAESLQLSHDRFASLVRNIPGVTYRFSPEEGYPALFVSEQINELCGYSEEELTGGTDVSLHTLIHPDDRPIVDETIRAAIEAGETWSVEYRIITRAGRIRWVQDKGRASYESAGNPKYLDGFLLDVTDSKKAESSAQKMAVHNRILAEMSVDPRVVSGNLEDAEDYLVSQALEALGVSRLSLWQFDAEKQLLRRRVLGSVTEEGGKRSVEKSNLELHQAKYPRYFEALIEHGHIVADDAMNDPRTLEFVDDYLKPLDIQSMLDAVIRIDDGIIGVICAEHVGQARTWHQSEVSFIISLATITGTIISRERLQETETALRRAKEGAEAAAIAKTRFLATMSHEIRTPMNGVLGMLNILDSATQDKQQQHYLSVAKHSAESLLGIIDDVLDFSKIEAGKMPINKSRFDLDDLLCKTATGMSLDAKQKGLSLTVDTSRMANTEICSDAMRVRQIVTNLLGNAIKFTQQGSISLVVDIKAENEGFDEAVVELVIADTGIGIDEARVDTIFDAFSQADATTTRRFGGTGLGLAIVKRLCELLGGTIELQSRLGKGSQFIVTLPLGLSDRDALSTEILDPDLTNTRVILCVNDVEREQAIKTLLVRWGVTTLTVPPDKGSTEAINSLESQNNDSEAFWDLLICDWRDGKGPQNVRRMLKKHLPADTPCLAIQGLGEHSASEDGQVVLPCIHTREMLRGQIKRALGCGPDTPDADISSDDESSNLLMGSDKKILIVEDNLTNQLVTKMMLGQLGYNRCEVVENGRLALELLDQDKGAGRYDLILMDCQMPEMDGFETSRQIRQRQRPGSAIDIPIVALTANAMEGDRERCHEAGMDDYLAKPLEPAALKQVLDKWLEQES